MENHEKNKTFLTDTDSKTRSEILTSIAHQYEITIEAAASEVTNVGCEHLLDYLTGSIRSATSVMMQQKGLV
jgi:hypothetical protein